MSVSAHMQQAAETLAGQIEAGTFSSEVAWDLRTLPPTIATWAEHVETMEQELQRLRATRQLPWWRRLVRASHPAQQFGL